MNLPINMTSLGNEMRASLTEIDRLLAAQKRSLESHLVTMPAEDRKTIYDLVDGSGQSPMAALVIAKANLLSAMANSQAADKNARVPRR